MTNSGVGGGDEVIVPSYGTVEVAEAVRLAGGIPVFADIDGEDFCLAPAAVAEAVTSRTAAVVAVHQFGHRADMARIGELAQRRGLLVLESETSHSTEHDTALRRANAAFLSKGLTGVLTPRVLSGVAHGFEEYVVRVPGNGRPDRDAFASVLRTRGIRCRVPVQTPVHRMPLFRSDLWLPETERAADECLALPVGPTLSRGELQRIVSICNALGGLLEPAFRPAHRSQRQCGSKHTGVRV